MADRCDSFEPLLSAWVDGELEAPRTEAVTRHLAGCRRCAGMVEDVVAVRDVLRNLPARRAGVELAAGTPLRAAAQPAPLPRGARAFAVAAGLLLGAALGLGGGGPEPDAPPVPEPADVFMVEYTSDQLARTFGAPVTAPALLETAP